MTATVKVGPKARAALGRRPYALDVSMSLRFAPKGAAPTTATRGYRLKRAYVARAVAAERRAAAAKRAKAKRTTARRTAAAKDRNR